MIFARRASLDPDPHLHRKVQIFFGGAVLALVGIALDSSLLVGLATAVLLGGVVFRLFSGRDEEEETRVSEEERIDAEDSQEPQELV